MNYDNLDYTKSLNSQCFCGTGLPWKKDLIVMVYPCEHLFHKKCLGNETNCLICSTPITKVWDMYDPLIHPQRFSDILSMSPYDDMSYNTPLRFIDSLFDLATIGANLVTMKNPADGKDVCEQIFAMNNITMKVFGLDKIRLVDRKIYICNHTSHLDMIIMYYLFSTGFFASSIAGQSKLIDNIKKIVPLLTFERGKANCGSVDMMKDFIKEKGSLCIYPEGMMKHPDTLTRFRTGAFNVGYPVYAITIRYLDIISNGYIDGFLYKLCSKQDMLIEVHVLGPYYPPFDENSIEAIRLDMAKYGKMVLSRVTNRDIKDNNTKL
jgi:hypothetical protein